MMACAASQDWISSRPGFVCDVLLVIRVIYFEGVPRRAICLPGTVAERESGLKAPEMACRAKPRGKESRMTECTTAWQLLSQMDQKIERGGRQIVAWPLLLLLLLPRCVGWQCKQTRYEVDVA